MSKFKLSIVTPDKMFFDGDVEQIITRTTEGDVGILKGHEPYIAVLDIGILKLKIDDEYKLAAISGGFMKVSKDHTSIIATTCEWEDEIDVERAKIAQEKASELLKNSDNIDKIKFAELQLKKAMNRLLVAQK